MYERLRAEPRTVVQRSPIHNLGLFCTRDINQHDMVIEYVGELVRPVVCSLPLPPIKRGPIATDCAV